MKPVDDMNSYRRALNIAGIHCLAAAGFHLAWHGYMPRYPVLAALDAVPMETIQLLNAAIALFLVVMTVAIFLVAAAKALPLPYVRAFVLLVMGFWAGRFLLELVMPVQIPILFIEHPGAFAKIFMAFPVLVLGMPLLAEIGKARPAR